MYKILHRIVIDSDTKSGRFFDLFIQVLILLSLISFSLETLPDLNSKTKYILSLFELISVIVFSAEFILRIVLTKSPFKYIFSFFGIIDLLAILPFYLASELND